MKVEMSNFMSQGEAIPRPIGIFIHIDNNNRFSLVSLGNLPHKVILRVAFNQFNILKIADAFYIHRNRWARVNSPKCFQQFMGNPVLLKTYKPVNGRKEFAGRLAGYDNGAVELDMGTAQPLRFEKQDIALVRLRVEF